MDKPYRTYDELIALLNGRGVSTGPNARLMLERDGYYPIVNGYKDPFLVSGDEYRPGTSLEEILRRMGLSSMRDLDGVLRGQA